VRRHRPPVRRPRLRWEKTLGDRLGPVSDHDRDDKPEPGTGACRPGEDCLLRVWDGIDAMTLRAGRTRITFDSLGAARGFNAT